MGIVTVLLLLAAYFKAKMDALAHSKSNTFDWEKKYDFTKDGNYNHWWYFGLYKPKFPERFPFSTTLFVSLTDSWHRNQLFMLRCFYLSIALGLSINIWLILLLTFIIFPIILGSFFEWNYNKIRRV